MAMLENKTALVTGGRQGIGRGIADRFAAEGARVTITGRGARPDDLPAHFAWACSDVSDPGAVAELAAGIEGLDILVNNAGIQVEKTITETSDADWDLLMGANAKGVFLMCRALIPRMSHGGSIINIGSISGQTADPGLAIYNASKAFVHGLTRSIAVDHGPAVRCNAVVPHAQQLSSPNQSHEIALPADGRCSRIAISWMRRRTHNTRGESGRDGRYV